jgi:hypothetical protein
MDDFFCEKIIHTQNFLHTQLTDLRFAWSVILVCPYLSKLAVILKFGSHTKSPWS